MKKMNYEMVKISELKTNPNQPPWRHANPELVESIKQYGVLQPIVITKDDVILTGHRRVEASGLVGLTEIPAIRRHDLTINNWGAADSTICQARAKDWLWSYCSSNGQIIDIPEKQRRDIKTALDIFGSIFEIQKYLVANKLGACMVRQVEQLAYIFSAHSLPKVELKTIAIWIATHGVRYRLKTFLDALKGAEHAKRKLDMLQKWINSDLDIGGKRKSKLIVVKKPPSVKNRTKALTINRQASLF